MPEVALIAEAKLRLCSFVWRICTVHSLYRKHQLEISIFDLNSVSFSANLAVQGSGFPFLWLLVLQVHEVWRRHVAP